jgi:GNAT superfamily N-acetyltransferase
VPAGLSIEQLQNPTQALAELTALRRRWATEQGRVPLADDSCDDDFAAWIARESAARRFWIARVDGDAVGMVNLLVFDRMPVQGGPSGGWGYLCNMFVDEAHRSGGIGAVMASELLDYADNTGLERVVLSPSERSRPFYASLGFVPAANLLLRPRH